MGPKTSKPNDTTSRPSGLSFFEVLEKQIRTELREELAREATALRTEFDPNSARAGAFESWMASHTERIVFKSQTARSVYGSPRPRARSSRKAQRHVQRDLTLEEVVALETLNRYSGKLLNETFDEARLKTAWRKAAFNTHPDRASMDNEDAQANAAHVFQEVTLAYQILEAALTAPHPAAA